MRSIAVVALTTLLSCGDATAPGARLLGTWTTPLEDIGSGYGRSQIISFHASGVMDDEVRIHQNGRVTDVYRLLYAYEVRGDSIFTQPVVRAQDVIGIWTRFDRGRFEVDRGRLTITYPWFGPADESITVTTVFFRQGCLDGMPMACM